MSGVSNTRTWVLTLAVLAMYCATTADAHDGHLNEEPWSVCEQQRLNDACAYTNSADDVYRGTCQLMKTHLICVRNQPIEKAETASQASSVSQQPAK